MLKKSLGHLETEWLRLRHPEILGKPDGRSTLGLLGERAAGTGPGAPDITVRTCGRFPPRGRRDRQA